MKNKFYAFIEIMYFMLAYFLIGIGVFVWFAVEAFDENIFVAVISIIMLLVLPFLLLLWSILTMAVQIEVTEEGLIKKFWGCKQKYFKWEEIKFVHYKGNFKQWIFLSKNDLTDKSLTRCRLSKETIYFFYSVKKIEIINHFAPENVKIHKKDSL